MDARPRGRGERAGSGLRSGAVLALLPCVLFLLVVYALPVAQMLRLSVMGPDGFTLTHLGVATTDPLYVRVLFVTLKWSVLVTLLCGGIRQHRVQVMFSDP